MPGGAPEGNQNAAKGARWRQAIDRALAKRSKAAGIEELDRLAEKYLDEIEARGLEGFKDLGDRVDGKPIQALQHTGKDGDAAIIHRVERVIVDSTPSTDS